jgi:hypothetical protein
MAVVLVPGVGHSRVAIGKSLHVGAPPNGHGFSFRAKQRSLGAFDLTVLFEAGNRLQGT